MTQDGSLSRDRELAGLLARLDVHRRFAEQRSALGTADARLLWLLSGGEPRTLRQISDALRLEQSTVNRQVHAAVAAGLVRRVDGPGPARHFAPTEHGRELYDDVVAASLGAHDAALAALGDEAEDFLGMLARVVDAYGAAVRPE
ncbi:MarR family winged helix-turn-helix transcriptional regulator [Microbacterium suaedae]|uniref:MarR family winged helix-turn-helix transcriptional regulator n=1 Tax=Microbacterium suaedae TaxID=2067813 RepID=UPI000DA1C320|nr:MarR family winged helix-turn-helix transcriptional regulator [Microbacterium suaedae]